RSTRRAVSAPMPEAPPLTSTTLSLRRNEQPPLGEAHGDAAIGHELSAGDEGRTLGGEPEHQLAEILRLGHASDRMSGAQESLARHVADLLPQRMEDRCVDAARMHRVAADAVLLLGAIGRHALAQ